MNCLKRIDIDPPQGRGAQKQNGNNAAYYYFQGEITCYDHDKRYIYKVEQRRAQELNHTFNNEQQRQQEFKAFPFRNMRPGLYIPE